ncbi:hypothetical protein PUN28_008241 [Cardiocondyla obscurior]|uniref:Uncharacterized protein n=1 Tax=Cardiocondyla obscurior TaxID=286306 RepID=A0AAW2FWR4_9HYME
MLRCQATTNITLLEIKQRLQKIENVIKRNGLDPVINDGLITQFLPLDTVKRELISRHVNLTEAEFDSIVAE